MSTLVISTETVAPTPATDRRSISRLLAPLDKIAGHSANLVVRRTSQFEVGGERHELPNYVFIGPEAKHRPVKIGIFAGLHGDQVEGTLAQIFLVQLLESLPDLARGYCLFLYPLGNPTGFEDNTHLTRQGFDLSREFWKRSAAPEIRVLEGELRAQAFDGIITLHANPSSSLFWGNSPQPAITQQLVKPALRAVEKFASGGDRRPLINPTDFHHHLRKGALSAPPDEGRSGFEIAFDAPNAGAAWLLTAVLAVLRQHAKTHLS